MDGSKSKGGDPLITEDQVGKEGHSDKGRSSIDRQRYACLRDASEDLDIRDRCVRKGCQGLFPDTGLYC